MIDGTEVMILAMHKGIGLFERCLLREWATTERVEERRIGTTLA